jgi:hypothetical protein
MNRILSIVLFAVLLSSLATAMAQNTTAPTIEPTPPIEATPTPEPTPTMISIGVQVINGTETLNNADVVIDGDAESTAFTGEADFMVEKGTHYLEIYVNNTQCHNSSLIVTKPEVLKINIGDNVHPTTEPTPTPDFDLGEGNTTANFVLLIIALTGVCTAALLIKRKRE